MKRRELSSFETFHRLVPSLVRRIGEDPALARRAMLNPILATEELGVILSPEATREAERRLRFSGSDLARVEAVEARLRALGGENFDPRSSSDVARALAALGIEAPEGLLPLENRPRSPVIAVVLGPRGASPRARLTIEPPPPDPLTRFAGKHELVDLLIEHRALDRRARRFVDREAYERARERGARLPVSAVSATVPAHEGGNNG